MKHIIVYGSKGCGKTHNRIAIMRHFGTEVVIDDWKGNKLFDPTVKGPFTDGRVVKIKGSIAPAHTVVYLYTSSNGMPPLPLTPPDRSQCDEIVTYDYADVAFARKESNDPLAELGLSEPRDDASIFQSSRSNEDVADRIMTHLDATDTSFVDAFGAIAGLVDDEDLMQTIIDAYDELRDRGYEVSISNHPDPSERPNTRTTHVTLVKKMKGDAKCNDQQQ